MRVSLKLIIFGLIILFSGIVLRVKIYAGALTAPLSPPLQINSYFDHSQPGFVSGVPIINNNITIFTGTTTTPANGVCGQLTFSGQTFDVAYYAGPGGTGNCIWYEGHDGIDFQTAPGTPVLAAASGKATEVTWDNCGGNYVRLWHSILGYSTRYFHLSQFSIATGTVVSQLQQIATSGGTGSCASGPHLHFDVRNAKIGGQPMDPYGWFGTTTDPYPYNQGYLWTTNPPSLTSPQTLISGPITQNTTWTASSSPYVIQGTVTVNPGVTLTIQPKAIIKFQQGAQLFVRGILLAQGITQVSGNVGVVDVVGQTSQPPGTIYFTSIKDDSVGGDTNGDGSATLPAPGDYTSVEIGLNATATLDNVVIRYGGGPLCCGYTPAGLGVSASNISINRSQIKNNINGIYIGGVSYSQPQFTIDNSLVTDNGNYGIYFNASNIPNATTTIVNTGFGDHLVADAYFTSSAYFINSGNYAATQNVRGFRFAGTQEQDSVWYPGVPFVIIGTYTNDYGKTLTFQPGVLVKFDTNADLIVNGSLISQGTVAQPIYITSLKDDSVGGDTNGDGTASSPAPGDYGGFYLGYGSSNAVFDFTTLRYGGAASCCFSYQAALKVPSGSITVANSQITDNLYGVHLSSGFASATLTIDSSFIAFNSVYGIYAEHSGKIPQLTVTNTAFGNNIAADAYIKGNVNFVNSGNYAVGPTSGFWMVDKSSMFQTQSQTWNPGIPYVIDSFYISLADLTINPGTVIKFNSGAYISNYDGIFAAVGTLSDRIYFTSLKDDSVGGDTNGDGVLTYPVPGDFVGVILLRGGSLENAVFSYGGFGSNGVLQVISGTLNATSTRVENNSNGLFQNSIYAIFNIVQSSIESNVVYGAQSLNTANKMNALNNWWGDPSGPYHPTLNPNGLGNAVSNNVNFIPWLTYDPN